MKMLYRKQKMSRKGDGEFEFNDEFFYTESSRKHLFSRFPNVGFALYDPDISAVFSEIDKVALKQKRYIQYMGFFTILLAFGALFFAALDIAVLSQLSRDGVIDPTYTKWVAGVAALMGIFGFVIGVAGLGVGKRKMLWLANRMAAERIRQWRWIYLTNNRASIQECGTNKKKQENFLTEYKKHFDIFYDTLEKNKMAIFESIIEGSENYDNSSWFTNTSVSTSGLLQHASGSISEEFFDAYKEIRIGGQLRYASYIVNEKGPFWSHPARQKNILHSASWLAIAVILGLHILVSAGVVSGIGEFKSIYVHLATVTMALLALALKAIEEGLGPDEQLRRCRGYRESVINTNETFLKAKVDAGKLAAIDSMERHAFEEMQDFLNSNNAAKYVM